MPGIFSSIKERLSLALHSKADTEPAYSISWSGRLDVDEQALLKSEKVRQTMAALQRLPLSGVRVEEDQPKRTGDAKERASH
jgi:hypothetical protein